MCGIIGFCGHVREGQWGETYHLLESLFLASEDRGQDATGFAALTCPYKSPHEAKTIVAKQPIPVDEFVKTNGPWRHLRHQRCAAVIGHVRMATHGAPADNKNNHPLSSQDGRFHLIHNGVIENYQQLASRRRLRLQTDCDSEVILRLVERTRHAAVGFEEALQLLEGSIAAALLDAEDGLLWLARNEGREIWLLKLRDGRLFLASTRRILLSAAGRVFGDGLEGQVEMLVPLAAQHVHLLSPDGILAMEEVMASPLRAYHRE